MKKINQPLILASSSKYRKELLSRLKIPFICISPEINETALDKETITETSMRLALMKAKKVSELNHNCIVIGSDQVAGDGTRHIGKPGNFSAAKKQLEFMSGKNIFFSNSIAVTNGITTRTATTLVKCKFKNLDALTIKKYLEIEKPFDVAGSVKSEGLGIILLEKIYSDDPTAILGLSIIQLTNILKEFHIDPLLAEHDSNE
ncbi:Maf family nucleotide pyrophosphatase [Candidatus Kinetoplastidibacterium crithidiae]|uniref:7-methyl-GTP pyrophosphatase n=1 Tax=Candidatus Kinetoplastidibacterium crithidiae TCC036E TaxID=1208918 RepID=M1M6R1_9PROT|nr:Maf family nucleotide pyrophosphatase [Candidatus Kinetoplastibacterium crithidii]AFZ82588.1 septum formation protein [Candidatus Kinetoplastibacterium crithidii (ex Angomonas deanei ATCC 30255)]AGF47750.1 septum formation protein [Candidatus Kinetoplastibacterium crithidii TCC036E]